MEKDQQPVSREGSRTPAPAWHLASRLPYRNDSRQGHGGRGRPRPWGARRVGATGDALAVGGGPTSPGGPFARAAGAAPRAEPDPPGGATIVGIDPRSPGVAIAGAARPPLV